MEYYSHAFCEENHLLVVINDSYPHPPVASLCRHSGALCTLRKKFKSDFSIVANTPFLSEKKKQVHAFRAIHVCMAEFAGRVCLNNQHASTFVSCSIYKGTWHNRNCIKSSSHLISLIKVFMKKHAVFREFKLKRLSVFLKLP